MAQRPYLLAIIIVLALIVWMALIPSVEEETKPVQETPLAKVKVEQFNAELIEHKINLYGRTEPNRVTTLRAEVSGLINKVHVIEGQFVTQGTILLSIDENDLQQRKISNQALIKQRKIQYDGAKSLQKKGYQAKVELAEAQANLSAAKAELKRINLDIQHLQIKAPYDGIFNIHYVEVGDYVSVGDQVALLVDLDPLIVSADVTEQQIQKIQLNNKAEIILVDDSKYQATISYIASISDPDTNTFAIEVKVPNPTMILRAGTSTEVDIVLAEVYAIKLTPALLALDEAGNIGVKTITQQKEETIVKFTPIDMVSSDQDGVWLKGLGSVVNVITLGQGFVRAGDKVNAVFEQEESI